MGKSIDIDSVLTMINIIPRRNYELPEDCGMTFKEMKEAGKLENKVDSVIRFVK